MKPRVTFIVNRKIKLFRKKQILNQIETEFRDFPKIVVQTDYPYHAMVLAQELATSSDFIIAVGGDGTANEVVNGLMSLPASNIENLVMGIYPAGTGNDFAKTMGLKPDMKFLKQLILNKKYRKINVGVIEYQTEYKKQGVRYFLNVADAGIGGEVVKIVNNSPRILGSNLTFVAAALQVFITYNYPSVRIYGETFQWQGKITLIAFGNAPFFGGGMAITPNASPFNKNLKITLVEQIPVTDFLKHLPDLKAAKHIDHPKIHYFETKELYLEPLHGRKVYVEADGELVGLLPAKVYKIPNKLNFLYGFEK